MTRPDFMTALFAAVTAIEEGKVAEISIEDRTVDVDGNEHILTVEARRTIRTYGEVSG